MRFLTRILAAMMATATMQSALAGEPLVIRFSHVVAPDSPKGQAAQRFASLVASRTSGKVRIDIYPNSQLYGDQDEISALQMGNVDMLAPSLTKLKVLHTPEFEVFDLPFLFQDLAAVHRITQGPVGKSLLAKLDPQGVVGLAFWDNGFKQMSANRPLQTPADFVGLSLRIQPSKILEAQMKALGARARPMQFNEVYNALKTGAVDGTEGPVSNFYTQNLHLAQKYLTLSNHGYLGYAVVANKKFWDGLPPEIRSTLDDAMHDATVYANEIAQRNNDEALAAVKKAGHTQVIELVADDKVAWQRALGKLHHTLRSQAPGDGDTMAWQMAMNKLPHDAHGRLPKELIDLIYHDTGDVKAAVSLR